MNIRTIHDWPKTEEEALAIQERLRDRVVLTGSLDRVQSVAGVDTAYDVEQNLLHAAICVMSYPDLGEMEKVTASEEIRFPYIPSLLAFREGPAIMKAIAALTLTPDLFLFSGHGIAHPRQFGLASHFGVLLEIPSIGCARKHLAGQYEPLGPERGDAAPLILMNQPAGIVYRSREQVKPIFISPGHLCGLDEAWSFVVSCIREYRLPEPLRDAHRLANWAKRCDRQQAADTKR
jgi:deoxyribonuclease V